MRLDPGAGEGVPGPCRLAVRYDPRRSRLARPSVGRLASLVLVGFLAGCADSINPVIGGLKIGVEGRAFILPVMVNERAPFEYPRDAWARHIGGETVLKLYISMEGTVDSVYVLESSGDASLDSAALANSRKLRYRPARQGDEPVAVWATLPVRYPMPEELRTYEP